MWSPSLDYIEFKVNRVDDKLKVDEFMVYQFFKEGCKVKYSEDQRDISQ